MADLELINELKEQLTTLRAEFAAFTTREQSQSQPTVQDQSDDSTSPDTDTQGATAGALSPTDSTSQRVIDSSATELLEEFVVIKDSLKHLRLPKEVKSQLRKDSIKREGQTSYAIITKCIDFAETTIRLLMRLSPKQELQPEQIYEFWIIQMCQIRYLQDEFANLQVQGRFDKLDPNIAGIFRSLQKQTSGFNETQLDLLHKSIDIAGAASKHPQHSQNSRWPQNTRGRPGFYRGQSAGQGQRSGDVFSQLTQRQNFPRRHPSQFQQTQQPSEGQ